ncbi:MAG: hypothetical protein GY754_31820 [bacterium]|nr:hypothetical protein [bacterium]
MELSDYRKKEMIKLVRNKLKETDLAINKPDVIARNLLIYYNYDIERVLQLAI